MKLPEVLVANRGEIAIQSDAGHQRDGQALAVFAEEDKLSLHRFKTGKPIGSVRGWGRSRPICRSWKSSASPRCAGADAIHPGYGLLSENPDFVDACTEAGITFIGLKAETMRKLGDKASARKVAIAAGVPVIPATEVLPDDMAEVRRMAEAVGYPFMLKASWGGGGRGMRRSWGRRAGRQGAGGPARGAGRLRGNGEGYLEKMILNARHVEVQILGDQFGTIYHLWGATARCSGATRRSSSARRHRI